MSQKLAHYWILVPLLVFSGALFAGCNQHSEAPATKVVPTAAKEVAVVQARLEPWPDTIRVQGSLLAYEDAVIGSKLAGRVDEVFIDIGSVVKAGQPLVTLVRAELDLRVQLAEAQLRQACAAIGLAPENDETQYDVQLAPGVMMEQALVNEAQANVERGRSLVASRALTQGEYDTLIAQLKAAQARYNAALHLVGEQVSMISVRRKELALARQAVVDSQITAPFPGIIGDRRVSPGEFVSAGQAVATVVRSDRLRFTAGVPESRAAAVRVGQTIKIMMDDRATEPVVAKVSRVSPTVMQSSRSILIQADVPNPELALQAGLFGEADLVVDSDAQAIVVPTDSVRRFAGVEKVWVVTDGVASQQTVRTGRQDGNRIEIVDGLSTGTTIVRNAAEGHDGPVVALQAKPEAPLQAQFPDSSSVKHVSSGGAM